MTADPGLVLAWLVLAHLVADFVLQPGRMARSKAAPGSGATSALLAHALVVGICVVPFGLAFGLPGWWVVAIVTFSHAVIDRLKSVLTRRAEAAALAEARRRHEAAGTAPDGLGPAWTPVPGALFAVDQAAHVAILVAAWAALLSVAPLDAGFAGWAADWLGAWDPAVVHIRAGALFVGVLVAPRLATEGRPLEDRRRLRRRPLRRLPRRGSAGRSRWDRSRAGPCAMPPRRRRRRCLRRTHPLRRPAGSARRSASSNACSS